MNYLYITPITLGMPYAFKQAGFGLGLILVLLVTIITGQHSYHL